MSYGPVEDALPPSTEARDIEARLRQELRTSRTRREKLATCEKFIKESAAAIEEKQLLLEVARRVVIQEELYKDTYKSVKQREASLGIDKQQLACSKSHVANIERYVRQFRRNTSVQPWDVVVQDQRPKTWSRAILVDMAKLSDLRSNPGEISNMLQEAMQNRTKRKSKNRGLSTLERLAPADVLTVIESIEQSVPTDAVGLRGTKDLPSFSLEHF